MPSEAQGKTWKLAWPFHGPYRVLQTTPINVEVCLVDKPESDPIFVALDRVRKCYPGQGYWTWTGHKRRCHKSRQKPSKEVQSPNDPATEMCYSFHES